MEKILSFIEISSKCILKQIENEEKGLRDIYVLLIHFDTKAWFIASILIKEPYQDLNFLEYLSLYPNLNVTQIK